MQNNKIVINIYILYRYRYLLSNLCQHSEGESVAQSCLTLCNPMDCSPPDSSAHGILQARILEWVAVPSSRWSSPPKDRTCISNVTCTGRQVLYAAGTYVVVQWLRLCAPKAGDAGSISGQGNQIPRLHR